MNFDFSEDQKFLRRSARALLARHCSLARVRAVAEFDAPFDRELWHCVSEMGWPGTAVPDAAGAAGPGYLELAVLTEVLGRVLAPLPFSSSVYLAIEARRLAGSVEQRARCLPRLARSSPTTTSSPALAIGLQGARWRRARQEGRRPGRRLAAGVWAPGMRIAGGTDEIMWNIIAERVLGLPPESRADKGIPFRDVPSSSRR